VADKAPQAGLFLRDDRQLAEAGDEADLGRGLRELDDRPPGARPRLLSLHEQPGRRRRDLDPSPRHAERLDQMRPGRVTQRRTEFEGLAGDGELPGRRRHLPE
jgi:hypothetical protein